MKENKLIAEFMGMEYGVPNDNSVMIQMTPQGNEVVPINSMEYHTSWDWLMDVVEKINNTTDEFGSEMDFQIGNGFVWVDHPIGNRIYFSGNEIDHKKEPMIDKVYKAVVEFIKEYNQ